MGKFLVTSAAAEPVIPFASAQVLDALGLSPQEARQDWPQLALNAIPGGRTFTVPEPLFSRISDEEVAALADRWGGSL